MFDFSNRRVLVTGGTRGIGAAIADLFLELGATVAKLGRKEFDFFDDRPATQIPYIGKVDICVNNAGVNKIDKVVDIDEYDWRDILEVNLTGPFKISQAVARGMIERKYGRIINISSIFGHSAREGRAAYATSKFGIRGLTQVLAAELAPHNILVNSVSPGFTKTDLTTRILGEAGLAEMAERIPVGRVATPQEIAKIVVFLASDWNTYISGQDIIVDGGFLSDQS